MERRHLPRQAIQAVGRGGAVSKSNTSGVMLMFNLVEKLLTERDYEGATGVLSALKPVVSVDPKTLPRGFSGAQIRVIEMERATHVFVAINDKETFWALPGDTVTARNDGEQGLAAKVIHLKGMPGGQFPTDYMIHFLYVYPIRGVINA